jgi:hypothetical protein
MVVSAFKIMTVAKIQPTEETYLSFVGNSQHILTLAIFFAPLSHKRASFLFYRPIKLSAAEQISKWQNPVTIQNYTRVIPVRKQSLNVTEKNNQGQTRKGNRKCVIS